MRALKAMSRRDFLCSTCLTTGSIMLPPSLHSGSEPSSFFPRSTTTLPTPSLWSPAQISICWIGHSTLLLNFFGIWILTDPVFSERIGVRVLGQTLGIGRYTAPALPLDRIPKPDIILLSHAHIDHTDLPTLQYFAERFPSQIAVITAKNTQQDIEHLPWSSLVELDWNQDINVGSVHFRALEVLHNGCHFPWERDRRNGYTKTGKSYNGYVLQKQGKTIVFAGDTAYTPVFSEFRSTGIDIALMPIGAYQGCAEYHCTPEEALKMADEMAAQFFIPMHCYTFAQFTERGREPLERLVKAARLHQTNIALSNIGQTFIYSNKTENMTQINR